jgi:hypothetical protein
MAGRTLYNIEDVRNLGISNENISDISSCDHGHITVGIDASEYYSKTQQTAVN